MAADISVKIALDGERDYRQALKNCNDALKNADSALKAFDESAKGNEKSIETLRERQKLLGDALKAAKEKQEQMTTAVNNAKAARDKAAEAVQKARKEEGENSEAVKKAEKQYIAANNAVDRWETQLNKANEQVAKYTNEMNGATDETEDFQKVVGNTAAMEALTKIADKVSGAMSKVNQAMKDASKEVETGLKQINKRTGASGAELEKYQQIARDVFTSIPTSIDTASDAVGELATRFKDLTDDQLANLTTAFVKFADLNETDVASAVDSTQKAMAAFGVEIDDAGQLLDVFNRTGQNTGANAADLASKLTQNAEAFQQMGMDIYQATEFLGRLEVSGADSSAVLMGLKTALKNATDEGKPFNEALEEMQEAILNGAEGMDGLNYAYEIFGTRSGAQVYNAVKNGTIDFKDLAETTDILTDAQNNLNDTYDNSLTVYDKYQIAQNNLKDASEDLQGEMNKALAPAIEAVSDVVKGLTDKFKELPPEVQTTVGVIATIGTTALEAIPQVLALISQIKVLKIAKAQANGLNGLSGAISNTGSSAKSTAGLILGGIGILTAFGAAATAAGEAVKKDNEATVAAGAAYETSLKNGVDVARVSLEEVVMTLDDADTATQAVSEATELQKKALQAVNDANADYSAFLVKYPAFAQGYAKSGDTIQDSTGKTVTVTKELWQEYESLKLRTEEASDALDGANSLVKDSSKYLEGLSDTTEDAADDYSDFGKTVGKAATDIKKNNGVISDSTRTMAEKIGGAVNTMKGSLQGAAQSVSDWFGEVAEQEAKSADVMAENLQAQIDSMKNWQENLSYLADKGINQDLLQYLANMGPSGANYVQAFVDAANGKTEVGLDEMNRLWEEKLDLEAGVNKEAEDVYRAIGTLAAGSEDQLKQAAVMAGKAGEELPEEYADGIRSAAPKAYDAARTAAQNAKDGVSSIGMYSPGYDVGNQLMNGISDGIAKNAYKANNAITNVSRTIVGIARSIPQVSSPSKVFAEIGKFLDMGLAQGIDKYAYMPDRAMTDTMKDLVQMPDLSRYDSASAINNQVAVYIGDKELTAIMAAGVVKNISSNQRAQYVASGGR